MLSTSWVSGLNCWTLLLSTLQYQVTSGNDRIAQRQDTTNMTLRYSCSCSDTEGNIYDLRRLIRQDRKPRFSAEAKDEYWFSYNPCVSFSLGQPIGNCFGGDVAICMWTNTSYQLIGEQSSFKCVPDRNGKPQFVYGRPYSSWSAKILLKCDHKKTSVKSASFTVTQDQHNPRTFLLTHLCACPNACTEPASTTEPSTEPSTRSSTGPSVTLPSRNPDDWDDIWRPISIAAGSIVFVVIAFLVIFRLIRGRNPPAPEARGLLHQENNQIDESRNSFPAASSDRIGSSDAEYVTPSESMTSTRSRTDITMADKNGIYKSKAANKRDKPI